MVVLPLLFAAAVDVAVLPVSGSPEASNWAVEMLKNVDGVRTISLLRVEEVLGRAAVDRLASCTEDQCFKGALSSVRMDGILTGALESADGRQVLRMRLIVTSTTGELAPQRTTHEVGQGGLASAMGAALAELFPKQAANSLGTLELRGLPDGAEMQIDGQVYGATSGDRFALRLRAGSHRLAVRAPGHEPAAMSFEIALGRTTTVELDLKKHRSSSPYIVAGIGGVALVGATILGVVAKNTANDWKSACDADRCAAGYTRDRYDNDRSNVDRFRVSANALFVVSGLAVAGAALWYVLDPGQEEP